MDDKEIQKCRKIIQMLISLPESEQFRESLPHIKDEGDNATPKFGLNMILKNLDSHHYVSLKDFESDVQLIWSSQLRDGNDNDNSYENAKKIQNVYELQHRKIGKLDRIRNPTIEEKIRFCDLLCKLCKSDLQAAVDKVPELYRTNNVHTTEVKIMVDKIEAENFYDCDLFVKECIAIKNNKRKREIFVNSCNRNEDENDSKISKTSDEEDEDDEEGSSLSNDDDSDIN